MKRFVVYMNNGERIYIDADRFALIQSTNVLEFYDETGLIAVFSWSLVSGCAEEKSP